MTTQHESRGLSTQFNQPHTASCVVSFAAVFWDVTQRSFGGECCVTSQKTAAKETTSCGSTRPFAHGKVRHFTHGKSVFCVWPLSHSETAHGKSLWIHQKEQKNYPWRFPKKVVGFSLGLSNHKSSSTNRVEEKSKSGNRSTCWAHFCGVTLKLRQISWHVPNSIHVASNMANFRGCLKPPGTSSEDKGIPKHVLAGEQLAGDGFYKTNTASEEIVEIVVADAFYAFLLTRSFG